MFRRLINLRYLSRAQTRRVRRVTWSVPIARTLARSHRAEMFRLTKKRGRRHKSADSLLVTAPVQQEKTKKAFSLLLPGEHIGRHTRSLGVVCNSSVSVCLFVVHACRPQAQGRAGGRVPQVSQRRMHRTHEAPPSVSLALPPPPRLQRWRAALGVSVRAYNRGRGGEECDGASAGGGRGGVPALRAVQVWL